MPPQYTFWGVPKAVSEIFFRERNSYATGWVSTNSGLLHNSGMPEQLVTASSGMFTYTRMMGATTIYEYGSPKPLVTLIPGETQLKLPIAAVQGPYRGAVYAMLPAPLNSDTTPLVLLTGFPPAHPHAAVMRPGPWWGSRLRAHLVLTSRRRS